MENIIEINGVRYIREDLATTSDTSISIVPKIEVDYTFTEECIVETDLYCWAASRIKRDDGTFYDSVSVKVTTKKGGRPNWKDDYWDNMNWFVGILNGNNESLPDLIEAVPEPEQRAVFVDMLKKLIEIGWMKGETK
jgi:hypothetical protein